MSRNATKRLAVLLTLLGATAFALPSRYYYSTQTATGGAPTLGNVGMGLDGVEGYRVSVCAESGQTLSGTGTLRAYGYHSDAGLWMRVPAIDLTVSASGVRCMMFPDIKPGVNSNHRVYFATDTVAISGGTNLDVRIDGNLR